MTDLVQRIRDRLELRASPPEWAAEPALVDSNEVRALLEEAAAALEAAREDAWQPIETAPKDGELILVCRLDETSTWPAWWRQRETFNLRDRNGWHSKENAPLKFNPTHWRPLPAPLSAPPAIDQARGKAGQEVGK